MKRAVLIIGILLMTLASTRPAAAAPHLQALGTFVIANPNSHGADVSLAALFSPLKTSAFVVGPRVGWLGLGGEAGRSDLNVGVDASLWFVNAIGAGMQVDWVAASTRTIPAPDGEYARLRFQPYFSARILRFQEEGAWALRIAPVYDSYYKWGLQVGVTLQFSGIPNVATSPLY